MDLAKANHAQRLCFVDRSKQGNSSKRKYRLWDGNENVWFGDIVFFYKEFKRQEGIFVKQIIKDERCMSVPASKVQIEVCESVKIWLWETGERPLLWLRLDSL